MVPTIVTLSARQYREFGDCAIALHDALRRCGDFEGRELLDCVRQRLDRAVSEVRVQEESTTKGTKDTEVGGEGNQDD